MGEVEHEAPSCPVCGRPMVARRARRGPNAGGLFWGCTGYPDDCKGTRDYEGAEGAGAAGVEIDTDPDVRQDSPHRTRAPVAWIDGTLERAGWTCRYTTVG